MCLSEWKDPLLTLLLATVFWVLVSFVAPKDAIRGWLFPILFETWTPVFLIAVKHAWAELNVNSACPFHPGLSVSFYCTGFALEYSKEGDEFSDWLTPPLSIKIFPLGETWASTQLYSLIPCHLFLQIFFSWDTEVIMKNYKWNLQNAFKYRQLFAPVF